MDGQVDMKGYRTLINLIRCLVCGKRSEAEEILHREASDMGGLQRLIYRNHLGGYLFLLVTGADLQNAVPAELYTKLETSYRRQVRRHTRLLQMLTEVKTRLDASSVSFLTLKGLYLSQKYIGDVNGRFMWDLDILVRPGDLERVVSAAGELGMERKSRIPLDPRISKWGLHALDLKGELGSLDIHTALRNLPGIEFNYDQIWSDAIEFDVDEIQFPTLSDEDTLLVSALGVGTDIQCSHHNLRKILDIYLILRKLDAETDWDRFFQRRSVEGSDKLIVNVFAFCLLLLGVEEDCPTLWAHINKRNSLAVLSTTVEAEAIFGRGRQSIGNRIFFSRLLPGSTLRYWLWWIRPLPIRYWYYRLSLPR